MNQRPNTVIADAGPVRQSARVCRVAELLDCDEDQVRDLLDAGEISGHGLGKRGVRIYLDSIADYQERQARAPKNRGKAKEKPVHKRSTATQAAHESAVAELRRLRLV